MSFQGRIERTLKEIHLMVAKAPKVKGETDSIVISRQELLTRLESISKAMYDMMDEYAVSTQERARVERELREKGEEIVQNANTRAEDVYGASVLYMDDAIIRLVKILDEAQKSVNIMYRDINQSIEAEIRELRTNQNELQEQMLEMRDANLYLNILNERRNKQEKEKLKAQKITPEKSWDIAKHLQESSASIKAGKAEVKVNPAYFERAGISQPEVTPLEEPKPAAPEVKVNLNADYFKWKESQQRKADKKEE